MRCQSRYPVPRLAYGRSAYRGAERGVGTIAPATWSFMLAARMRGLGTAYTSLHLFAEEQAAHALGIPFPEVMQAALIPVAYYTGETFKPAKREPLASMVHWGGW